MHKLLFPVLYLSVQFLIAFSQENIETSNLGTGVCKCSPSCVPHEGDCKLGRVIPRQDCPCCKVCQRQEGEACDSILSPCDTKAGLTCSSNGVCEAETHCKVDSDCPTDRFCVRNTCTDPCPLLQPCLGALKGGKCVTKNHQANCECPKGTIANHEINACHTVEELLSIPSLVPLPSKIGCKVGGEIKRIGEHYYNGDCSEKCICMENGEFTCGPLSCPHGLFPSGSSKNQRFCIEIRSLPFADECCVVLACSNNLLQSINTPSHKEEISSLSEFKNPKSLTGRKVTASENEENISEFDYQKRLEELEAILNSNITLIKDNEQLAKDKHILLSKEEELFNERNREHLSEKLEESTADENGVTTLDGEVISQTERATLTTFPIELFENKFEHSELEEALLLQPPTTTQKTTSKDPKLDISSVSLPTTTSTTTEIITSIPEITTLEDADHSKVMPTIPEIGIEMETSPPEFNFSSTTLPTLPIVSENHKEENLIIAQNNTRVDTEHKDNSSFLTLALDNNTSRDGKEVFTNEGGFKPTVHMEKEQKFLMHHEKFSAKPGSIQAKSSTHNSSTVYLPSKAGGVLHYKESRSNIEAMKVSVEEGKGEIEISNLTPNTKYTFKWAGNDGSSGKMETRTEDGCLHNGVSYAVGAKWHEGCATSCGCHIGGISECKPRCTFIAGAIKDDQCTEKPLASDPECCVEYDCEKRDNSLIDAPPPAGSLETRENKEGEPKLIVTSRTHNSVTVAWDDFSADNPDRGYVAEYREVPSIDIPTEIPWMKKEALKEQPPPTMTIDLLKPNTLYEVRVGIYSQAAERRLTAATETITVRTEPGCVYGNTSFPVGDFFQGCEERCSCTVDGSVKCSGRCTIPYFNKGSFANDPLCSEITEEGDECCVLVMCAHGGSSGVEDYDQCANTVCGKNAECVSLHSLTEVSHTHNLPPPGSCRCKEGFSGDPADHVVGCVQDPSVADDSSNCNFRLNSYSPGDVFYDGCSYKCMCSHQREIECQPRCQYSANETLEEPDSSCSLIPDPEDQCCKIRVCNSTFNTEGSSGPSPALDFDGCIYRNRSFTKNESFTFGCDSKCLCMGFGDISCYPRCPPIKDAPKQKGVMCETLIDPEDECCNVTVCDNVATDIMKANATTEGAEEDNVFIGNFTSAADVEEAKSLNESLSMMKGENATEEESMNASETSTINSTSHDERDLIDSFNMTVVENMTNSEHNLNETEVGVHEIVDLMTDDKINKTLMEGNDETLMNETFNKTTDHMNTDKHLFGFEHEFEHELTTMFDEDMSNNWTADEGRSNLFTEDHHHFINEEENLMKKPRFEDIVIPPHLEIGDITPLDSSTVKVTLKVSHEVLASLLSSASEHLIVSYSHDSLRWTNKTIPVGSVDVENMYDIIFKVPDLEAYDAYQFKVYYKTLVSPTKKVSLSSSASVSNSEVAPRVVKICHFKGKDYNAGENFYDECEHYCECTEELTVHCSKIECPARFGLRIMDPGCLEWEDDPTYVATPPKCCGQKPKCALHIDHLACEHMGQKFQHLDFIPKELVGCDQRCQCLSGQLDCENLCPPVTASPPFHLDCERHLAKIVTVTGYPCCREWQCTNYTDSVDYETHTGIHSGTHFLPPIAPDPQLSLIDVTDITEHSVRIIFIIDDTFIGLPVGLYLRYTSQNNPDPNSLHWESEIIQKEGVVLTRKEWDYMKKDLDPDTNYTMQLVLLTNLKKAEIVSKEFTVTTAMKTTTPLPRLDLDAELSVSEIKNTSAKISWKHFTDYELQYIDGIRVRFWPGNKKFPLEGPMLHREADNMILRDLDPDKSYTVDLFFIPHQGLTSTISNTKNITFTTLPKPKDKYAFNISIHSGKVTKKGVQVMYSGVPEPEGKFINVYRVVYTSDGDSQDSQKFKVPKAQKDGFITITDLKPGVEYEVWLEAYLTNGSKKKSNVITIKTEPGELPVPEKSELGEPDELKAEAESNYYSAFVTLAVIVTLACLVILGLIVLLLRRQSQAKAHINSSKTAYDNPSYKTSESSGFAMEMNGLKSTTNGSSRTEEP